MGLTVDISFVLGLDLDLLTDGGVRVAFHCSQPDHCLVVQFGTPQEALKGEGSAEALGLESPGPRREPGTQGSAWGGSFGTAPAPGRWRPASRRTSGIRPPGSAPTGNRCPSIAGRRYPGARADGIRLAR